MASGATTPGANAAGDKLSKTAAARTRLIEQRLRRTRGQVKWTEMITAFLLFAAGSLVFLFAFVLFDHWVVSGGVGFWGRLVCLLAFMAGGGYFLFRAIGPLVTRRINPLYAAATIERGQPALKNSLVNFLLLRSRPQDVNPAVFRAIQRRAARDIQDINPEEVIDRSHLIKAGYVLMTVVAVCCLYTLVSSKSPFRSVGRMFVPWADVEAPTRVGFSDVRPGSRQAFHDEFIDVSALVQGIDEEEPVTLYYSTADGQSVDMPLVMTRPEDSFRHQVTLPQGSSGIQQDIEYYIAAGDARTHNYNIHVESAPAIIVDRVDFKYPDYTGLSDRGQPGQGDVIALEGTRVKISARANQPIEEAFIDFDCNGSRDLEMQVNEKLATVSFVLRMNEDRTAGEFESYEIRFTNKQGQENPRPARHRLEVTPDLAPVIEIVSPAVDEIEVPINAAVDVQLRADDPDFSLSNVTVHARRADQVLLRQELLKALRQGEFTETYQLRPSELGLKVGDEIVYWADARDNKRPTANRTQTIEYRLRVAEPTEQPAQQEQRREDEPGAPDDQSGEQQGDQDQEEQPAKPEAVERPAESAEAQEDKGEEPDNAESEPQERIDPEAQPGEAFEEILKHMEEEEQQEDPSESEDPQDQEQDDSSQGGDQQPGGEDQSSEDGGQQGKDEQSPSEPSDEQSSSGGEQGESGDQQAGGGEQSSEGGEQGETGSGAQQGSEGGDQASGSGGQQESSDSSNGANKQQSPGGDQTQDGGEGGMKSKDSGGSSEGTQSPGGEDGADQGQDSPAAKDGTEQRDRPGTSKDGERGDSGRADSETKGDGGESGGQGTEGSEQEPNESEKQSDARGGDPEKANGSGGDGEKGEDDAGTGSKQGRQKPKDTQEQSAPSDKEAAKDEASPESESGRESDSQGDNSGDKSGGGEEGAGKSADSEGTGSAGSNTSAEEGAGQSEGAGSGPTSDQAGDKSASDSGSDRPGEKAEGQGQSGGEGQQSSSGQPKDPSGEAGSGDSTNGQPPTGENEAQQGDSPSQGTGGNGNPGQPQGQGEAQSGGQPSGNNSAGDSGENQPEAEDPNLDYAREATDLALEHLRDQLQQDEPDQELLDRLQWTREDMEKFVNYWEQLKRQASQQERGEAATEDELRDALQGLGLRRKSTQIDSGQSASDQIRQLRESRRTSPPPEYAEQFRSFTEGTSRQSANSNEAND